MEVGLQSLEEKARVLESTDAKKGKRNTTHVRIPTYNRLVCF